MRMEIPTSAARESGSRNAALQIGEYRLVELIFALSGGGAKAVLYSDLLVLRISRFLRMHRTL